MRYARQRFRNNQQVRFRTLLMDLNEICFFLMPISKCVIVDSWLRFRYVKYQRGKWKNSEVVRIAGRDLCTAPPIRNSFHAHQIIKADAS
jgi:hypothetical protein